MWLPKSADTQRISKSLTYFFADGPSPLPNKLRKDSKTMLWENAEKKMEVTASSSSCKKLWLISNNMKIGCILQKQRKGEK